MPLKPGTMDVWLTELRGGLIKLESAQQLKYCPLRNENFVNDREVSSEMKGKG